MSAALDLFAGEGDASPVFEVTVYGTPQPAGSKKAIPFKGRDGRLHASVSDANKKAKPWKTQVAQACGDALPEGFKLFRGPLAATFTFYRARPKGHLSTKGDPRPSAPAYPITRPDALKLARGVEDAMSGVVYSDDSLIVDEHLFKRYGEPERVEVQLHHLPAKVKDQ